jgi:hypothetical protein
MGSERSMLLSSVTSPRTLRISPPGGAGKAQIDPGDGALAGDELDPVVAKVIEVLDRLGDLDVVEEGRVGRGATTRSSRKLRGKSSSDRARRVGATRTRRLGPPGRPPP